MTRHFLDLRDINKENLLHILDAAHDMKKQSKLKQSHKLLPDKKLAMIFEKNSTRTRVSFEAGMFELGGHALHLSANDLQLGRGESIADTARVLSRYVDIIMMRANSHADLEEFAKYADIPVINGLTDLCHPCQIIADLITIEEKFGRQQNLKLAWVGDGNNVANSLIAASAIYGFDICLACPEPLSPEQAYIDWAKEMSPERIKLTNNPIEAVNDAQIIVTDTWVSMGDKDKDKRIKLLAEYQVNDDLISHAAKDAIFMHCLPAHRGEEVSASVIDGDRSVVWDEAENRLHAQKAILCWCLGAL